MNRADRILALYSGTWGSAEAAIAAGVTVQDADDALALARLDLDLDLGRADE